MSKYTFIEFIAAQEGDDFNVIEGDNLAWARSFVKGMGDLPNWRHEGDCTKENYTCTLCVYELYLKEYREYYFKEEETLEQASLRLYPVNIVKLNDTLEMDSNATKRMAFIEGAEYNAKQNENR
jgi:hypothetical protein